MKYFLRTRKDFLRLAYERVSAFTGERITLSDGYVEKVWWLRAGTKFDPRAGRPVRQCGWEDAQWAASPFPSPEQAWQAFDELGDGAREDYEIEAVA